MPHQDTETAARATDGGNGWRPAWAGRPAGRRRRRTPSGRAVLGATLVALAVGGMILAQRSAATPPGIRYLVVTRDLAAGDVLGVADLGAVRLDLPAGATALPASGADRWTGRTVARPLRRMDLLRADDLVAAGRFRHAGSVAVSVEVPAGRLPTADLAAGSADVLATDADGGGTRVLATSVPVQAAPDDGSEGIGASDVVAVRLELPDRRTASEVVDAAVRSELTLVVPAPGGEPTRG